MQRNAESGLIPFVRSKRKGGVLESRQQHGSSQCLHGVADDGRFNGSAGALVSVAFPST